ncbi:hypothetical protein NFJ02_35g89560 [Pycnococcus provasolii]
MVKDFFGTFRLACVCKDCACLEFISKLETLTRDEYDALGGAVMSCQRRSDLTLLCATCGHSAAEHAPVPSRSGSPPPVPFDARDQPY